MEGARLSTDPVLVGFEEVQAAASDGRLILGKVRVAGDGALYLDVEPQETDEHHGYHEEHERAGDPPTGSFQPDEEVGPG